jgi:hypothetical protein
VILVFVDGLGLAAPDPDTNPLTAPELSLLASFRPADWTAPEGGGRPPSLPQVLREQPLEFGGRVTATDASLGVPGIPQSATGQATLLTGTNAARLIGAHLFGFPNRALRDLLLQTSILKQVLDAGQRALFINAYRPRFFELADEIWQRRLSATTWAHHATGLPFRTLQDVEEGRAIYQDITHDTLRERGFDLALRAPERAGEILARVAGEHDLTLFEFFQTDRAGHARDRDRAVRELSKLERFLRAALTNLDLTETTLILTSDHGNIEDLGVKTHTMNPVPTLVFGPHVDGSDDPQFDRLESVTPEILQRLLGLTPRLLDAHDDCGSS